MDYIFSLQRRADFNAAYWAAQPAEIVAASKIADFDTRQDVLLALANSGAIVDKAIMVWGWDPYQTFLTRWVYGYTWAPNILDENNISTPGVTISGEAPYDPNTPDKNSIAVHDPNTFDLTAWFPPLNPPAPPPLPGSTPAPFVDLTRPWPDQGPNAWYSTVAGYGVLAGQTHVDPDGRTYVKIVVQSLFTAYQGWRLVQ